MAQTQVSFFQDGVERVRETVGSIESELARVQKSTLKDLRSRRRRLERQWTSSRKDLEKRTRRLRRDLEKNATVKQALELPRWAVHQLEQGVDGVLGVLQIASKSDLERIDRKLTQLGRKLREIDQSKRRTASRRSR